MKQILAVILMILSMFEMSCAQTSKEERFWRWFQANEARLFEFEGEQERIFSELEKEMHKVHENLTFEFGQKENGKREFVISANGIKEAFPAVVSLADNAPELPRWKITKFRPRTQGGSEITMDGVHVKTDQVKFTIEPDGDKAGITLYFDGYDPSRSKTFAGIGFILLDHALGEYDMETKVGFIEFKPISESSKLSKMPFAELPSTFDRFTSAKVN